MRHAKEHPVLVPLILLLTLASGLAMGCRKAPRRDGLLSIPTDGNVRIVSREVENASGHLHWKWSVIGERNWRKAAVAGTVASLTGTYALNDATERGGCNIWEGDLDVAEGRWTFTLHGSDGTTAKDSGTLAASTDLAQAVRIQQEDDKLTSLPADLTLAAIDGKPLTLHIER